MQDDGGNPHCNENRPLEASTSLDQQKKSSGNCTGSSEFVNHGNPCLYKCISDDSTFRQFTLFYKKYANAKSIMCLNMSFCSCNCMGREEKKMDRRCISDSEVSQNANGASYKVL